MFIRNYRLLSSAIWRSGSSYTALSAADGFWCFLNLAPGSYTFTADLPGTGTAIISVNNLVAGEVRTVNIAIAAPGTATRLEIDASTPTQAPAGSTIAMLVHVVDAQGNAVTTGSYNLSVSSVGVTGTLTGSTSGSTVNGDLTFTLSHDQPATITFIVLEGSSTLAFATTQVTFTAVDSGGGGKDNSGCAVAPGSPWAALWAFLLPGAIAFSRWRRRLS